MITFDVYKENLKYRGDKYFVVLGLEFIKSIHLIQRSMLLAILQQSPKPQKDQWPPLHGAPTVFVAFSPFCVRD